MFCLCSAAQPPEKHSYLIDLVDSKTNKGGRCIVQSECEHGMQEWITELGHQGVLVVVDAAGKKFTMLDPIVLNIDPEKAAHIPLVESIN